MKDCFSGGCWYFMGRQAMSYSFLWYQWPQQQNEFWGPYILLILTFKKFTFKDSGLWYATQQRGTVVPDRITVLTLLIPASSVRAVSACLYTVLIISLLWVPPPQWTSFPKPSGHTSSRDFSHTACSYLQLFGTYSHTQTHPLREWCQFGVLNESRRTIQHFGLLKRHVTPCTY